MAKTIFSSVKYELSHLLGDIDLGRLALPELQRPFVWKRKAVRELLDSMYRGYPVGYLMLWNATAIDSKVIGPDGKQYTPTEFIVDGQQRLTSLYAVMKGKEVTFADFQVGRIVIAFRPRDGDFEIPDAAIEKDPEYLPDITPLWAGEEWKVIDAFIERLARSKPEALADGGESKLRTALNQLVGLRDYPFDAVRIGPEVTEEKVAEIFMRVNSGGTELKQADFILTLLSVFREGDRRKLEDFSRLCQVLPAEGKPSPYNHLVKPAADQLLRVAVLVAFHRGRLQAVLALLRGASIETKEALPVADRNAQLDKLGVAIDQTLDLTSWHEYLKALMAAGFRRSTEISSPNSVFLVYALYLIGRGYGLSHSELRTTTARFLFMAMLSGRYTRGSFETQITADVQSFTEAADGAEYLDRLRAAIDTELTPDFWAINLPQSLATSAARSPVLYAYAAALSLLDARVPPFAASADGEPKAALQIRDLFDPVIQAKKSAVERHHLFPKRYLEKQGIGSPRQVNQIANLSYVEWPDNIQISDTAPADYWEQFEGQFSAKDRFDHALPEGWQAMSYPDFLEARRAEMAKVIKAGFERIGAVPTPPDATGQGELAELGDAYLNPDLPFSNETAIRQRLRRLRGHVFWYEQHMDRKALELLGEELDRGGIEEVRLLSGPTNISVKAKKSFERFAREFEGQGIGVEWKVLSKERSRSFHARVLADDDGTWEIPPLNSILAGTLDSIRESDIPLGALDDAWDHGDTVPVSAFPVSA